MALYINDNHILLYQKDAYRSVMLGQSYFTSRGYFTNAENPKKHNKLKIYQMYVISHTDINLK